MFRFTGIVIGLIAGALFGLPALAATVKPVATVEPVAGQVSLSRGHGFKGIRGPTQANAGDSVMVGTGGHGKIVYFEGCMVDVFPGAVVGVAGSCKVATAKPMTLGEACDPKDLKCLPPVAVAGAPIWPLLVGAALIGGAICAGACESEEHHHGVSKD